MTDDPHHDHNVRDDDTASRKPDHDDANDSRDTALDETRVAADETDKADDDDFNDNDVDDNDFGGDDFGDDEPEDDDFGDEDNFEDDYDALDEDDGPVYPLYKLDRDQAPKRSEEETHRIDVGATTPPDSAVVDIPIRQDDAPADDNVADSDVEYETATSEPSADGNFSSDEVLNIPADDVSADNIPDSDIPDNVSANNVSTSDVSPDHNDTATQVEPVADDIPDDVDEARKIAAFGAMATPTEDAEPSTEPSSEPAPAEVYIDDESVDDYVDEGADSAAAGSDDGLQNDSLPEDTVDEGREESLEQDAINAAESVAPPVTPPVTPPAPQTPSRQTAPEVTAMTIPPMTAKQRLAARARQLKLDAARGWVAQRKYNGAAQWLIELVEEAPTTPEAETARNLLLDIAAAHEAAGRTRLALDLYDKMQQLP
ncbi:MAG: hypothetical protein U5L04_14465 [Trueperaceae bacterium]|nr:hypothetical protein [Trueperaceae bacterium]